MKLIELMVFITLIPMIWMTAKAVGEIVWIILERIRTRGL
jgi:hypothetical protein